MFGETVRVHRDRLGLTQEELAARTGVAVRTLRDLEADRVLRPRPATVRLLAEAFGLAGADRELFHQLARPRRRAADATAPARRSSGPVTPAQLPADVAGFTGRAAELHRLTALLDGGEPSTAVVIAAVAGMAGVGKTALAVHWAHRVADRFPDGQLYVNLRGYDAGQPPMSPAETLRDFLSALQVPPDRIPASPAAQAALYRSLLANRRVLVVLDNARDAEQVRPLLPGSAGCLAVVTSRSQLAGLLTSAGAQLVALDMLSTVESRALLAARLGAARVSAEPAAVDDIGAACARLPLALAIAAARAATHPHLPLAALAVELADARRRLDALTGGEPATDVRAVFSWSYQALSADAGRLFRLLGLHPGPDISAAATASLAGLPAAQTRRLLAEFAGASLITQPAPGRYACHDLLRSYAADLADTVDADDQRYAAVGRMLDHYLHSAYAADQLVEPHRDRPELAPARPGVHREQPADSSEAMAWFSTERPVLLAATGQAARGGFDAQAWQLAWLLDLFLDRQGHWPELVAVWQTALAAAERLGDRPGQARAHRRLASTDINLGRYEDAHRHLGRAFELLSEIGDLAGQAHTHGSLAMLWERQGRPDRALDHAQQALDLYRAAGHRRGQADALNAVGWYHALAGDHHQALLRCEEALTLLQQLGDRLGEAGTWDSLGYAHHHLGHHLEAIGCYQHALELFQDIGDRLEEATTAGRLGDTHHALGATDAARTAWQHALDILDDLGHSDAEAVRAKLKNT